MSYLDDVLELAKATKARAAIAPESINNLRPLYPPNPDWLLHCNCGEKMRFDKHDGWRCVQCEQAFLNMRQAIIQDVPKLADTVEKLVRMLTLIREKIAMGIDIECYGDAVFGVLDIFEEMENE